MEKLKDEILDMIYWAKEQRYITEDAMNILLENTEKIFTEARIETD